MSSYYHECEKWETEDSMRLLSQPVLGFELSTQKLFSEDSQRLRTAGSDLGVHFNMQEVSFPLAVGSKTLN